MWELACWQAAYPAMPLTNTSGCGSKILCHRNKEREWCPAFVSWGRVALAVLASNHKTAMPSHHSGKPQIGRSEF